MTTSRISENIVALTEDTIEESLRQYKQNKEVLTKFKMAFSVVKPKNQELEKNVLIDVDTDFDADTLEDTSCYDNLVNYVRYTHEKYVMPLYTGLCKIGDLVIVEANVDEDFFFVDDECTITLNIPIPNNFKLHWSTYIQDRYGDLTKFQKYIKTVEFESREYQMQKVKFTFTFPMEEQETVKYLMLHNDVDNDVLALYSGMFGEVAQRQKEKKYHTHKIPVVIKDSDDGFGPLFTFEYGRESMRSKI